MSAAVFDAVGEGELPPTLDALEAALGDALPALGRFASTPQDPEWHAEGDVRIHTGMVLDELAKTLDPVPKGAARAELVFGALLHDYAKPWTTREAELGGKLRVVAPRHEAKGRSALAPLLLGLMPFPSVLRVLGMVGSHHEPKLLALKSRPPGEVKRLSRRAEPQQLLALERADMRGRVCPDLPKQLEHLDLYELMAEEYSPTGWTKDWAEAALLAAGRRSEAVQDFVYGEAIRLAEAGRLTSPAELGYLAHQHGRDDPPELVITVAPSGAGKTRLCRAVLEPRGFERVSLDDAREELTGDVSDQTANGQARQLAKSRLKAALRPGRKVVWDATSLRRELRAMIVQVGLDYGALVTFAVIWQRPEDYAKGNRARADAVPDSVLRRQLDGLEWPEADEAHRIVHLDGKLQVLGVEGSILGAAPWGLPERAA
ncbi:MAG: AAA family ATPase [Deltaproteobacteria bacterium]|nr:AAA family ATPase [Deltaproteobacteria bacterium]